jgi:hypothetical protein
MEANYITEGIMLPKMLRWWWIFGYKTDAGGKHNISYGLNKY